MKIQVTKEVLEGIEAVRDTGQANMFDWRGVVQVADALGFDEAATWIALNSRDYFAGVMAGFKPIPTA